MANPPSISNKEKEMLKALQSRSVRNPIEWGQYKIMMNLPASIFNDGIAHLVAAGLIASGMARQGFLKTIFGKEPDTYLFITDEGRSYLQSYGHTTAAADAKEAALLETPEDKRSAIAKAVSVYDDIFSKSPIYSSEDLKEATARLDEDIRKEIEFGARDCEKMWDEYEARFGHRGAAQTEEQSSFRDPVIITTTVRMIRAMDEQLKRLPPHQNLWVSSGSGNSPS